MKPSQNKHPIRFGEFPSYKGGHTLVYGKYIWEFCPGHHLQNNWGWVAQHRLIAEDMLGRRLIQSGDEDIRETVHHKDENPLNNSRENLQIMTSREHRRIHARKLADRYRNQLTREQVIDALKGRTLTQAAQFLKVSRHTICEHFPDLAATRKRKSPTKIDNPVVLDRIVLLSQDKSLKLKDVARMTGVAAMTVKRVLEAAGHKWSRRSLAGISRPNYCRKPKSKATIQSATPIVSEMKQ